MRYNRARLFHLPMHALKTIRDIDVTSRRVLVRVDFNIPIKDGRVADDTRIREALPTLEYLISKKARIILVTHLGRPKGVVVPELRLTSVAARLAELLHIPVATCDEAVGANATAAVAKVREGEILLLENIRFYPGEEANDPTFAKALAAHADIFVQEAFGTAHRAHASTAGVAAHLPTVAGFLVEKEVRELSKIFHNPARPLVVVTGGAKIDTKIGILRRFVALADKILLGGGIANTFLAAKGFEIGQSLYQADKLDVAREIIAAAGDKLVLPTDVIAAAADAVPMDTTPAFEATIANVPNDSKIYDIGPATRQTFAATIAMAGTVVWNGPVGFFERAPFAGGTEAVARAVAAAERATTILGGGDTIEALTRFQIAPDTFTHVSTGGGAMLEFLEGEPLPGIAIIATK